MPSGHASDLAPGQSISDSKATIKLDEKQVLNLLFDNSEEMQTTHTDSVSHVDCLSITCHKDIFKVESTYHLLSSVSLFQHSMYANIQHEVKQKYLELHTVRIRDQAVQTKS